MTIGRLLAVIGLGAVLFAVLGCDGRYEFVVSELDEPQVYRFDSRTGEMCLFRVIVTETETPSVFRV